MILREKWNDYYRIITAGAAHRLLLHASDDDGRTSLLLRILPLPRYRTELSRFLYLYKVSFMCLHFSQFNSIKLYIE